MAIMVVLAFIAVPAAREVIKTFESTAGLRSVISAALCNARAIAAKEQKYAGIRFQQDKDGRQYIAFIIHDPSDPADSRMKVKVGTNLANGFRAIEGKNPIRLPANAGLLDLKFVTSRTQSGSMWQFTEFDFDDRSIPDPVKDALLNDDDDPVSPQEFDSFIADCSTFSIVFSPTGKLVTHDVRIRNRHAVGDTITNQTNNINSLDDIFNKQDVVLAGDAMFYQDDYFNQISSPYADQFDHPRYGPENARNRFVIYNRKDFEAEDITRRWSDYLKFLDVIYVNPHTGEIINK